MATIETDLIFVAAPTSLPNRLEHERVVVIDLAFAHGATFDRVTWPFIEKLGDRLAAWIDHHPHPEWARVNGDGRFLLRDKRDAPACPQLISPELVHELGFVDAVVAHADFDGCLAAVKFMRGGCTPYPEADEDARAIDTPGHGYACSDTGERIALAFDRAQASRSFRKLSRFMIRVADALITGGEPAQLTTEIDALVAEQRRRLGEIDSIATQASRPHPEVLVLTPPPGISAPDRKALLRILEHHAKVAVITEPQRITAATFYDDQLDLSQLTGLNGLRGFAWGQTDQNTVVREIVALVDDVDKT